MQQFWTIKRQGCCHLATLGHIGTTFLKTSIFFVYQSLIFCGFFHLYRYNKAQFVCLSVCCSSKVKYFQNVLQLSGRIQSQPGVPRKVLEIQENSRKFHSIQGQSSSKYTRMLLNFLELSCFSEQIWLTLYCSGKLQNILELFDL